MTLFSRVVKEEEYLIHDHVSKVQLVGFNGSIRWVEMDQTAPRIVVEKEARGLNVEVLRELLHSLEVEVSTSDQEMALRAKKPFCPFGVFSVQTRFIVQAPPKQIREFTAQTSNGAIGIDVPFTGKLVLSTSNGRVEISSGTGQVDLRTSNGRISFGKLELQDSSSVFTSNGRIEGQVELPSHGEYVFSTSNGSISLRLPHESSGSYRARTSNGKVHFNLGEDQAVGQKEVVIQGAPGPNVMISTTNGNISVQGY